MGLLSYMKWRKIGQQLLTIQIQLGDDLGALIKGQPVALQGCPLKLSPESDQELICVDGKGVIGGRGAIIKHQYHVYPKIYKMAPVHFRLYKPPFWSTG